MARRLGILGSGALGTCFAVQLARAGDRIVLLPRTPRPWLEQTGLRLETAAEGLKARCSLGAPEAPEALDAVLLFVKAHQLPTALEQWSGWLDRAGLIASFANGLGSADVVRARHPDAVAAATAQAATALGPGHAYHAGAGPTWVGKGAHSARLVTILTGAGIECSEVDSLARVQWEKLAVSAAINPVSALLDVPNGAVWSRPAARAVALAAAAEVHAVARARGVEVDAPEARVEAVCRATAGNTSSMRADLQRGRRSEIDAICGAVVAAGAEAGVATPVNATLAGLVTARRESNNEAEHG